MHCMHKTVDFCTKTSISRNDLVLRPVRMDELASVVNIFCLLCSLMGRVPEIKID